jgi:hypothetical protein
MHLRETSAPLDPSEESRDKDGVEGVVSQASQLFVERSDRSRFSRRAGLTTMAKMITALEYEGDVDR